MLNIGNKTFMNLQEAVGWLLENNALPYQSTANYVGNTEIAMSTLINPSPAKVRVGSLIFFADSKVSTVVGVTSNSFIVSDQYNDLVDDVVYVSNVALNASGHLIVTLSNGNTIDAGLVKQVTSFSINGSQHLIATYNDGSTTDLGAIFSGNITISGNLTVTGDISGDDISGNSIIEYMDPTVYRFLPSSTPVANLTREYVYVGMVKNGNKFTYVYAMNLTRTGTIGADYIDLGTIYLPQAVADKIYPTNIGGADFVDLKNILLNAGFGSTNICECYTQKGIATLSSACHVTDINNTMTLNQKYYVRYEVTILLSDNLAS